MAFAIVRGRALNDHLLAQIVAGLFALLAVVYGGVRVNRGWSQAKRDNARDDVESGLFESALATMAQDRDRWRRTAENAWSELQKLQVAHARLEGKYENAKANWRMSAVFAMKQNPDVDLTWLLTESRPASLPTPDNAKRLASPASDFGGLDGSG